MDIDRDRMTVEFASKVADLGNWDSMERILFSHKTMTMISNQNLYETRNPYDGDDLHKKQKLTTMKWRSFAQKSRLFLTSSQRV